MYFLIQEIFKKFFNLIDTYIQMIKNLGYLNNSNYKYVVLRRIILFLIDSIISIFALIISLNNNASLVNLFSLNIIKGILLITTSFIAFILIFLSSGAYSGITRFTGSHTIYAFSIRNLFLVIFIYLITLFFGFKSFNIAAFFNLFIYLSILSIYRFVIRDILRSSYNKKKINLAIFISNSEEFYIDASLRYSTNYQINYFIDNSNFLRGRNIDGIKIISILELKEKEIRKNIDKILIDDYQLNKKEFRDRVKLFQDMGYELLYLPQISKLIDKMKIILGQCH